MKNDDRGDLIQTVNRLVNDAHALADVVERHTEEIWQLSKRLETRYPISYVSAGGTTTTTAAGVDTALRLTEALEQAERLITQIQEDPMCAPSMEWEEASTAWVERWGKK